MAFRFDNIKFCYCIFSRNDFKRSAPVNGNRLPSDYGYDSVNQRSESKSASDLQSDKNNTHSIQKSDHFGPVATIKMY